MTRLEPFPWSAAMRFGFGVLGLSSETFWRLTPRELASAFSARVVTGGAPGRADLAALMAAFPDEVKHG